MESEPTAEALLEQVARRDYGALAEIYDRFAPRLLGMLVHILPEHSLAEEVLQEVFVRLWDAAASVHRSGGSAAAWLTVMAREAALERVRASRNPPSGGLGINNPEKLRARKPAGRKPSKASAVRPGPGADVVAKTQFWLPRPEEIALVDDRLVLLQKALNQLPKGQRQALELAFAGGYTEAEIARELGEPLGKVRTALRAAITFLRHRRRAVLGTWAANI
jgi:RNA polymerase sigma-70 factor (ECF subfamily)